jgi:hypothetical protein
MAETITITILCPIPARKGWARDSYCRVLAGCYETSGPGAREVYVREQIGVIEGWGYCEWDGTTPTMRKLYVKVQL